MLKELTLYHTINNDGSDDFILENIPFKGTTQNPWLGVGYYFWENFIDPAEYWGKTHYKGKYIITTFVISFNWEKVYDLLGNTDHISNFQEVSKFICDKYSLDPNEITVGKILNYLKDSNNFDFHSVRVDTTSSFGRYRVNKIKFTNSQDRTVIITNPAIQICIYDMQNVEIVKKEIFKRIDT